ETRSQVAGQLDRRSAVARLRDDLVALLAQHLGEIETDERLVLGDEHAVVQRSGFRGLGLRLARSGGLSHGGLQKVGSEPGSRAYRATLTPPCDVLGVNPVVT